MLKYLICEIGGKQVKLFPNKPAKVLLKTDQKEVKAKVLAKADDKKLEVGKPFFKEMVTLKVISTGKGKKIRVGKFHAKANYRRAKGERAFISTVMLAA